MTKHKQSQIQKYGFPGVREIFLYLGRSWEKTGSIPVSEIAKRKGTTIKYKSQIKYE